MSKPNEQTDRLHDEEPFFQISLAWLELGVGLVVLVMASWYMLEASRLPESLNQSAVGVGYFPMLVAIGTLIPVFTMVGFGLAGLLGRRDQDRVVIYRPFAVILTVILLFAQVFLFDKFGSIACLVVFSALIMIAGGERRIVHLVGVPAGLTVGIYVIFVLILNVPMP